MKYFYDTEFMDQGDLAPLDLISIGIVAEDGSEYYAVSDECDQLVIRRHPWMAGNVWPHLPLNDRGWLDLDHPQVKNRSAIAREVLAFLTSDGTVPELWAWYDAHDFIALTQLWGPLHQLPEGLPKCGRDLKQEFDRQGCTWKPPTDANEHNALADARWNMKLAAYLGLLGIGGRLS